MTMTFEEKLKKTSTLSIDYLERDIRRGSLDESVKAGLLQAINNELENRSTAHRATGDARVAWFLDGTPRTTKHIPVPFMLILTVSIILSVVVSVAMLGSHL